MHIAYERTIRREKLLNKQLVVITCGFPLGLSLIELKEHWSGLCSVSSLPPPPKANRPNPCPATPITHRLRTHSPSHTAFIWAWNGFLLSARMHHLSLDVILSHPPIPFLLFCATRVPFCFHRKMHPPTLRSPQNTFPGWLWSKMSIEIPMELIFYMTTWIRSKSETHDGPNLFKTNHSHPWNPQEKGMFMKFFHNWHTHTHTHTHTKTVQGCIKYWYLPLPHDFTCPEAESLFSERKELRLCKVMVLLQQVMKVNPVPGNCLSIRTAAICQQKLHNLVWFKYICFLSLTGFSPCRLSDLIVIEHTLFGS